MSGRRFFSRAPALAIALFATAACMNLHDPMNHGDVFREQQRQFSQYIRWGNFQGAAGFVVPEQRAEFVALAPELTDVRFTEYEILSLEIEDGMSKATADVLYTGYRLSSPISRSMLVRQTWEPAGFDTWHVRLELDPLRKALGLAAK